MNRAPFTARTAIGGLLAFVGGFAASCQGGSDCTTGPSLSTVIGGRYNLQYLDDRPVTPGIPFVYGDSAGFALRVVSDSITFSAFDSTYVETANLSRVDNATGAATPSTLTSPPGLKYSKVAGKDSLIIPSFIGGSARAAILAGTGGALLAFVTPSGHKWLFYPTSTATPAPPRNLAATPVPATTIGGVQYNSSSKLTVSWLAGLFGPPATLYRVAIIDQGLLTRDTLSTTTTSVVVTGLNASTSYRIEVTACAVTCASPTPSSVGVTTPAEAWQLQGTGNTVAGLTKIVSDGNVRLHVLRYGLDAPAARAGRLQLYYGPSGVTTQILSVATASAPASQTTTASYLNFTSLTGSAGLASPPSPTPLVTTVNTGQAVPLTTALGGTVRLYFEATGADGKTRIMSLDSQDGYTGLDFNAGPSTVCSTVADYSTGGGCVPAVAIGIEGDATLGNLKIANARQFKIGVPTQTDWRWDGAAGTFMVFTTDAVTGCTTTGRNQAYAVWSGTTWAVQYAANGCPKLFTNMQAAYPVHIGGTRYKMYYGDVTDQTGKLATGLPFLGPKKVIYADAARTGTTTRVDYEDWDAVAAGRVVTFLWPDGTTLNATANGYIDDFSIVAPTASLTWQMFYVAITDGNIPPITVAAILINP